MKLRYRLIPILLCALLLLTGCTKPVKPPEAPTTGAITEPDVTTAVTEPAAADISMNSLRQAMVGKPKLFAVAYFG